jgi:hypothetical protein
MKKILLGLVVMSFVSVQAGTVYNVTEVLIGYLGDRTIHTIASVVQVIYGPFKPVLVNSFTQVGYADPNAAAFCSLIGGKSNPKPLLVVDYKGDSKKCACVSRMTCGLVTWYQCEKCSLTQLSAPVKEAKFKYDKRK